MDATDATGCNGNAGNAHSQHQEAPYLFVTSSTEAELRATGVGTLLVRMVLAFAQDS